MDDVYVYFVRLPQQVNEIVTPCFGGFTVYIEERLDLPHRLKAYRHALRHIARNDFARDDVQAIEGEAHEEA